MSDETEIARLLDPGTVDLIRIGERFLFEEKRRLRLKTMLHRQTTSRVERTTRPIHDRVSCDFNLF